MLGCRAIENLLNAPLLEEIDVFTRFPGYEDAGSAHSATMAQAGRLTEKYCCRRTLVHTNGKQLDPWLVAQTILASPSRVVPHAAAQSIYIRASIRKQWRTRSRSESAQPAIVDCQFGPGLECGI